MGGDLVGTDCGWKPTDGFESFSRYEALVTFITEQVSVGQAKEMKVRKPYSGLQTLEERWFRCSTTGETWRLIAPDPPFPGLFDRI
jgi:hypothetical protein